MQVISQKREKARDNSKLTYRFMFVSHQTDFQDIRVFSRQVHVVEDFVCTFDGFSG